MKTNTWDDFCDAPFSVKTFVFALPYCHIQFGLFDHKNFFKNLQTARMTKYECGVAIDTNQWLSLVCTRRSLHVQKLTHVQRLMHMLARHAKRTFFDLPQENLL